MDEEELLQFATEYHERGDVASASELYQELLRINPAHHRALYMFGRLVQGDGDHAAASDLFRRAIAAAPKQPDYHNALGLTLLELGNYSEAEGALHRAIRLRARPEYHNSFGLLLRNPLGEPFRSAGYAAGFSSMGISL
jgi:Tfp pilus assembly protein PilF